MKKNFSSPSVDSNRHPQHQILHQRPERILRIIFATSELFLMKISDVILGICWNHFFSSVFQALQLSLGLLSFGLCYFFLILSNVHHLSPVLISDFCLLPRYLVDWPVLVWIVRFIVLYDFLKSLPFSFGKV